ncbi:MAG: hypothetical protein AUK47_12545 [Deltaproteobacteria bacterium CG2_30_63_29]|nr:MAG: hypothetical protein AUK47_12545 [Deltaproteobacteria bacterium CG2_30_63_29]PIW02465.1 MAG: hypothetical protein COW42_01590 [Deltaproteobacteria bacterium CG17_big_fil_post_rev_8_21_14_2_50_63_7]PJB35327.1 MAG: hypothetical protein CO108_26055 [Deltaproteobacteria bacterium CG_4_9_14_3_um_filter_63_12]
MKLVVQSIRFAVVLALVGLVSGCSSRPVPVSKTGAERVEEARRLREGLPFVDDVLKPAAKPVVEEEIASPEVSDDPLLLGEFYLVENGVVDGDTVKVEGLDASLRLLGIDTEETFKKDADKEASDANFAEYLVAKRGDEKFPAKFATPAGELAKDFAKEFFAGHKVVRLEYDDLGRTRGVYNRYLVYVFVKMGGKWVNYNVECVRAGMSPYFPKYGYSRRYHDDFVQAQDEARAAQLGVWNPSVEHYPDYDERLEWWDRRAQAIQHYEETYKDKEDYFQLGLDSEWQRMAPMVGKQVTIFGNIGEIKKEKSPYLVQMSHVRGTSFSLVAFELADFEALDIDRYDGEYFYVRGKLSSYKDTYQFKAADIEAMWME